MKRMAEMKRVKLPTRIRSVEEAKTLKGVGDKTAMKVRAHLPSQPIPPLSFHLASGAHC